MMKTTKEERDEWRKLTTEASEGPWRVISDAAPDAPGAEKDFPTDIVDVDGLMVIALCDGEYRNVALASVSAEAIPALLDDVDALTERVARLEQALMRIASYDEGQKVTGSFDEPCAARIARDALVPTPEVAR